MTPTRVRSPPHRDGAIVFAAYAGERPVIDGAGVETGSNGVLISHAHIVLRGTEIRNWICGVWMEFASFAETSDCEVHNCVLGVGASFGTHHFTLNRVSMHHFDLYGFDASPGGGLDCHTGVLNDCVAYNVFDGFDISARDTTFNGCVAYDCWNGAYKLWQYNVSLVNCIGYGSVGAHVELDWDGEPGTTTLINCTFHNAHTYTIWVENARDRLVMYNTILSGGRNIGLAFEQMGVANYQGDWNLSQNDNPHRAACVAYTDEFSVEDVRLGAWTTYSGQDGNSIVVTAVDELHACTASSGFRLIQGSPAIDRGTPHLRSTRTALPDHRGGVPTSAQAWAHPTCPVPGLF